jgi:hypothetical protein
MEFSEACEKMVRIILSNEEEFVETYTGMLQRFVMALEDDETPAMALALAKQIPQDNKRV